ncbi:pilus assembly protein TadG-related protein [Tersicoccus sp. Bi-70]|uniref:pilus assembly protein TadG-related protein n=1 Tax=Tersicoccus sp. Bi-70 TaxID=1897634 RepID=UPI001E3669A5|nr:pilus assembly protein TadG-related protein [Tersicoccus sp. Bi-70]
MRRFIRRRLRAGDREAGQTTVLIIGFVLLTLLVTSVAADITAVYIEHKKLLAVADSAALAAADTFDLAGDGATTAPVPVLHSDRVGGAVRAYLGGLGPDAGVDGLAIGAGTGTTDGRTAQVELHGVARPPLISILVPDGIPITAVAQARAELRQ